ncbi:MAG: hypothetical protein H0V17_32085 [Deltaproteobacteria bacterium]|nr:hypothetical protein [Deltaproteobacteria bacterium]
MPTRLGPVVDREQRTGSGYSNIFAGDQRIDIAMLYVQVSHSMYSNVGVMAGCGPLGVSPSLHVHPSADGALISPSAFPPGRPAAVTPPPALPPPVPEVVVEIPWTAVAVGTGGTTAALVAFGTIGIALGRRRRVGGSRADRLL